MDKLIDAFCKWDQLGQGFFLLVVLFFAVVLVIQLGRLFVALFHGWPAAEDCEETCKRVCKKECNDKA